MKIAVVGAAGVRTPLIVQSLTARQERLGLDELALMDIDAGRLELIGALCQASGQPPARRFKISPTTDAHAALDGADYVITTFRVGGIASRVIDERVPLSLHVLGQETTGPGGFAMGLRSIPVLQGYIAQMRSLCPQAWLINFANPAGMLVEAAVRLNGWRRVVGICDAPSTMSRVAAAVLHANPDHIFLDYFGLNHLGWVRSVRYQGQEYLPALIQLLRQAGALPFLPFDPDFIASLGLIPNEYLYYYYHTSVAIENILSQSHTRAEQIAALNQQLFADLQARHAAADLPGMQALHRAYLQQRGGTYMQGETGHAPGLENLDPAMAQAIEGEGYAGVALDLIEGLSGRQPRHMVLNIPNQGAIAEMAPDDVVEVPAYVNAGLVQPLAAGGLSSDGLPPACLDLMKRVKAYERLTIQAAQENSYARALEALCAHPLVPGEGAARSILDGYLAQHGPYFPQLER